MCIQQQYCNFNSSKNILLKFVEIPTCSWQGHDIAQCTVAFSPTLLINCRICSYPHSLTHTAERLKKTIHDKYPYSRQLSSGVRLKRRLCQKEREYTWASGKGAGRGGRDHHSCHSAFVLGGAPLVSRLVRSLRLFVPRFELLPGSILEVCR